MKPLREYQRKVIDELREGLRQGHTRQILAMATGAGKTRTAAEMIHTAAKHGYKSLFVVDRVELVEQAVNHLREMNLQVGILQGNNTKLRLDDEVVVASIQTIRSREAPKDIGFVIIDEVHIFHKAHIKLTEDWPKIPMIGLSATPLREDLGKYFSNIVRGPSIQWLTDNNFLVPAKAYCPSHEQMQAILADVKIQGGDFQAKSLEKAINRKELIGDIISTWQQKAIDRQTLVFAVDIAHSKAIIDDFLAVGIKAVHIDAYTDEEDRKQIIAEFKKGSIQVLSSVNVLGIGFDAPQASCAVIARPTLSEALHIQYLGRVLRTHKGKDDAIILDHAGNTFRFGLPIDFEVPDLDSSDRNTSTRKKRTQEKMIICPSCNGVMPAHVKTCLNCGTDLPVKESIIYYLDGELGDYSTGKVTEPQLDRKEWYLGFRWYGEKHGYKPGWAYYAFQDKFDVKPQCEWKEMLPHRPSNEQARWIKYYTIKQAIRRKAG